MKKTSRLLTLVCLCAIAFTSCKKEYECACTANINIFGFTAPANASYTYKDTKKNAQKNCDNAEKDLQTQISGYGTASCTLNKK